jgi:hypothetical protein
MDRTTADASGRDIGAVTATHNSARAELEPCSLRAIWTRRGTLATPSATPDPPNVVQHGLDDTPRVGETLGEEPRAVRLRVFA